LSLELRELEAFFTRGQIWFRKYVVASASVLSACDQSGTNDVTGAFARHIFCSPDATLVNINAKATAKHQRTSRPFISIGIPKRSFGKYELPDKWAKLCFATPNFLISK
jgi:hypothetical protein